MADSASNPATLSAANLFNVNGMVAVVTGGGTGIGLMITKALVANGAAKVYILGRRLDMLQQAVSSIGTANVVPITCDVTSVEALSAAASQVAQDAGFVNLLVCNSGIGGPLGIKPKPETTIDEFISANMAVPMEEYMNTFAVNTSAVWYTTMAFLKLLDAGNARANLEQKSQVVAVSSVACFNKSKAACTHMIKQLSVVLPQWNIRANVICPGVYPSEMSAPIMASAGPKFEGVPLKRFGDEHDMGGTILYLASRAGGYCNGTVVVTDGGRLTTFPSAF